MSDIGDNRLAILAGEIRQHHAGVSTAAEIAANHAIEAGKALLEAKALVAHGQWLKWLEANCGFAERTAQLYMRIAEKGTDASTVAMLGLKGAATSFEFHDHQYDPFAACDDARKKEWLIFACFVGSWQHAEWVIQKQFTSPDEWLGPIGQEQCRFWGMRPASEADLEERLRAWAKCRAENLSLSENEVVQKLNEIEAQNQDAQSKMKPRARRKASRARLKSAPVADLPRLPKHLSLAASLLQLSQETDPEKQRSGLARLAAELREAGR